jgi:CBS domain containing-hemolysin-like protein
LLGESVEEAHLVSTLSGWFLHKLGRFPRVGDELALDRWTLRVESVDGAKVSQIRLEKVVEQTPVAA